MLDSLAEPIANLLAWIYSLTPGEHSYGLAIVLLTIAVMLIVTPLTYTGTKSMIKMQRLQPEMKRIQKKYKDDRQQLNEELMAFYKENQVNPLGGCLPLLIQLPVFLVLFQVLRGLTRTEELANGMTVFDPRYISHSTELYQELHMTDEMNSFGMDLAKSATEVLSDSGIISALPYLSMIVVVLVTSIIQQRQVQGRNPNAAANPTQQMIMRVLPLMLAVFSFTFQAALVVYFVVSNLFRVGQQYFITRTLYGDEKGAIDATARPVEVEDDDEGRGGLMDQVRRALAPPAADDESSDEDDGSKGTTAPKGRATPERDKPAAKADRSKGKNKRTTAPKASPAGALPQPRPRKRKKR